MPTGIYKRAKIIPGAFKKGHTLFKGKNNPFYGKKHSINTRLIMSKKAKERVKSNDLPWTRKTRSLQHRINHSLSLKGKYTREKSKAWKGGITKSFGYTLINIPNRGYILRSHLVMEKKIGRLLNPKEVVHHINEIKDDDRIDNLILFPSKSAHVQHHWNLGSFKQRKTIQSLKNLLPTQQKDCV